ncbi:MAG: SRPBCC domain-containing protein [Sphingomicrobium sp.]
MEPTFRVFIIVNRPRHEVFEAVADPKELSSYFTTGGASARLEQGQTVTWDFADFPGAFPVHVSEVVPDEKIVFSWKAGEEGTDYQLQVTMNFTEVEEGRTKVEVEESGWHDTEAARKASYGNCMGWAQMLAALKMWAEHKINLREGAYK